MGSPGTVLRGLERVSGGPERVHGVPKLEILSFLQPLWCDLHVFQGPTWDRLRNWNYALPMFFTTEGCHLCEQAGRIIDALHDRYSFEMEIVDIATEEDLVQKFGLSIPVLLNIENNEVLYWPFDRDGVVNLLDA